MPEHESRFRRYFPPQGAGYELFDTSVFLGLFGFVGYLLTTPPPGVVAALSAPLQVVSERQLGAALTAAAVVGVVCSYLPDYLGLGYLVTRIAAAFLTLNFLVALAIIIIDCTLDTFGMAFLPTDVDLTSTARSAFLYALIFGWATRRLSRDNRP